MKRTIYHSIVLDNTQVDYLMGGTAGINRMACLFLLIRTIMQKIESTDNVGESPSVLWQLNISEVSLSKLWKCDRKTVSKMLDSMAELGILSSVQTRRGSVHTLLCVSAWNIDGTTFANPNYVLIDKRKMKPENLAFHFPSENKGNSASTNDVDEESSKVAEIPNKDDASGDATSYNGSLSYAQFGNLPSSLCLGSHSHSANEHEPYPQPSEEDLAMEEEARLHFNEEQSCQADKDRCNS